MAYASSTSGSTTALALDTESEAEKILAAIPSIDDKTVFPEHAPILLPSDSYSTTSRLHIPQTFWQAIYSVLRESGNEWTDVRVFNARFTIRAGWTITKKYLKEVIGVRSLAAVFPEIPWIEIEYNRDLSMYIRLSPTRIKFRKPPPHFGKKLPPHMRLPTGKMAKMHYNDLIEGVWKCYSVPEQPQCVLPPGNVEIPVELRQAVYELLANWFPRGTDIITFCEGYCKRFGSPIDTPKDCRMPLEQTLTLMADIIDTGKAKNDHRLWIRPIPWEEVKKTMGNRKILEDGVRGPLVPARRFPKASMTKKEARIAEAMEVRGEVHELLSNFERGILVENLAILYEVHYPKRGMKRGLHEELRKWLAQMTDFVELFEGERHRIKGWYAKLLVQDTGGAATSN